MAGAYEIVYDCFRVVITEENNEEQGNSTPKVNEVEYSTVLSLTVSNRKQTRMCVCNRSLYGLSPFYRKALVSANTFKFYILFFLSCLAQKSGMNTIRSRGYMFFSCSAEIMLSIFVIKSMLFAEFTQAQAAFDRGICHLL